MEKKEIDADVERLISLKKEKDRIESDYRSLSNKIQSAFLAMGENSYSLKGIGDVSMRNVDRSTMDEPALLAFLSKNYPKTVHNVLAIDNDALENLIYTDEKARKEVGKFRVEKHVYAMYVRPWKESE